MSLKDSFISSSTRTLFCPPRGLSAIRPSLAYLTTIPLAVNLFTPIVSDTARTGGVRTRIALHHGRKTESESFASCRGRVNISDGREVA